MRTLFLEKDLAAPQINSIYLDCKEVERNLRGYGKTCANKTKTTCIAGYHYKSEKKKSSLEFKETNPLMC